MIFVFRLLSVSQQRLLIYGTRQFYRGSAHQLPKRNSLTRLVASRTEEWSMAKMYPQKLFLRTKTQQTTTPECLNHLLHLYCPSNGTSGMANVQLPEVQLSRFRLLFNKLVTLLSSPQPPLFPICLHAVIFQS